MGEYRLKRDLDFSASQPGFNLSSLTDSGAWKLVWALQLLFILIALPHLDSPFLSAHFERQNQTYDLARHVFHDGWRAVLFPKTSFSLPEYAAQPFTIVRFEVPFHGILGWPIAALTGRDRVAVRVVSLFFAVLSIRLIFLILRQWLKPGAAVIGTTLWATAPLVLHFGQAPMPDILCTTGVLAAFYFGVKGRVVGSSLCFLFAILAKESVLPFGLPILVSLLEARNCRSWREIALSSIAWGILPLTGLIVWFSLDFWGPKTPWSLFGPEIENRGGFSQLINPNWYAKSLGCLFPFGAGIVGALGVGLALWKKRVPIGSRLFWAIVISCLFYLLFVVRKIDEPQYFLPLLVWLVVGASFSLAPLLERARLKVSYVAVILTIILAHLGLAFVMARDLKMSRVPDFAAIQAAGRLIPEGGRVLVAYRHYGAGPAIWLNHNVLAISEEDRSPAKTVGLMRNIGFKQLLILDVESRHSGPKASLSFILNQGLKGFTGGGDEVWKATGKFEGKESPVRQFAETNCQLLYENRHVLLYSLYD